MTFGTWIWDCWNSRRADSIWPMRALPTGLASSRSFANFLFLLPPP